MARRLVALAVAVLMVVAAVVIRARIDDSSDSGSGASGSGAGPVSLVCATELEPACTAILKANGDVRVTIEPAGVTASRLEGADSVTGIDGWLVEAPWPEIVDEARARNGLPNLFEADPPVLARSPLVMAMWNDRLDTIVASCDGGALTWKCVGDVAGKQWSAIGGQDSWHAVKPGFADPINDGVGALVLGQAAVSFFGTTDLSSDQFNGDEFQHWIRQMATAVPQNPTFADMLTFGQSAVDVVGTTEAEAGPGLEGSRDKSNITITYPAPVATADVVLAQVAGASGGGRLGRIVGGETGLDALAAAAWRVPNHPGPAGVQTDVELPAESGLPSPGAIDASAPRVEGRGMRRAIACVVSVAFAITLAACSSSSSSGSGDNGDLSSADPGDCIVVDMASSPEKITLMTELAKEFNGSDQAKVGDKCVFVRPRSKASGAGAALLSTGWPDPDANGPQPVIWSPAASAWGAVVNQRLVDKGEAPITQPSKPFMLTPLVIAMPKPMAEALGYPDKPLGFSDIIALANDPKGWAAFGHPEWGPFRLGKTNPNFSTSGLNFTIAQYYAATGKSRDLTLEDLTRPDVKDFSQSVESAVVHYGDTTLTFLNNMYKADQRGTALTYASAVAVEEKSVIDYNTGNPDGILDPGEVPRPPRIPLVSIYPKEGTLFSDSPLFILNAPWVTDEQKQGAALFRDFVTTPENEAKVLAFGFRPGNPAVAIGDPITPANGADPNEPQALLEVPDPKVAIGILDQWDQQRKPARVLLVMDVSGSMGDPATEDGFQTKLDLAKQAAISALGEFKDEDEVGLRVFSTDLTNDGATFLDLVPIGPIGQQRAQMSSTIDNLVPTNGTPLYDVTADAYKTMLDGFDPSRINAVVLLTDGRNEDENPNDDADQLDGLLAELRNGSEGQASRPVRVFPIAYGADADLSTLRRVADATTGAAYDSSNPTAINDVFAAVVSNF